MGCKDLPPSVTGALLGCGVAGEYSSISYASDGGGRLGAQGQRRLKVGGGNDWGTPDVSCDSAAAAKRDV